MNRQSILIITLKTSILKQIFKNNFVTNYKICLCPVVRPPPLLYREKYL